MDQRSVLQTRYPQTDFSVYFRFLEACQGAKRAEGTNDHHICPRKQFPEYADGFPENLITLKIEDHDFAHKLLAAVIPEMRVNVNNHGYCGLTAEQRKAAGRKGGLLTGARGIRTQIEKGLGVHALGFDRSSVARLGGKSLTREQYQAAGKAGGIALAKKRASQNARQSDGA